MPPPPLGERLDSLALRRERTCVRNFRGPPACGSAPRWTEAPASAGQLPVRNRTLEAENTSCALLFCSTWGVNMGCTRTASPFSFQWSRRWRSTCCRSSTARASFSSTLLLNAACCTASVACAAHSRHLHPTTEAHLPFSVPFVVCFKYLAFISHGASDLRVRVGGFARGPLRRRAACTRRAYRQRLNVNCSVDT